MENVVCALRCEAHHRQRLREIFAPAAVDFIAPAKGRAPRREWFAEADIVLWPTPLDATRFEAPRLQWIHLDCSGIESVATRDVISAPFAVTSAAGRSAPAMAEHALFLMLSICYRADRLLLAKWLGKWGFSGGSARRGLFGRSVLIIGMGHTGRALARLCVAAGMRVTGFRRKAEGCGIPGVGLFSIAADDALEPLLPHADFIVLAASLNDTSHRLLGAERLALLKEGAAVINIARGALVDETALAERIRRGHVAGYGADVFVREPLPALHAFRRLTNVYVSPHQTPQVPDRMMRSIDIIEENYARLRTGQPLINRLTLDDLYSFATPHRRR